MKLIITISNGQATYEVWENNLIEIENGTNEKLVLNQEFIIK